MSLQRAILEHGAGIEVQDSFKSKPLGCCSIWMQLMEALILVPGTTQALLSPWGGHGHAVPWATSWGPEPFHVSLSQKGLTFPARSFASWSGEAICHLPTSTCPTTCPLPAGVMTQPVGVTSLPLLETKHHCVCFLCSCCAGLFFHLLFSGPICDVRVKEKQAWSSSLGYFHLSSATSCHWSVVSVRVTCALQGEGRVEDSKAMQLLALNSFDESSQNPKLQLQGTQITSLPHSSTRLTLKL